MQAFIKSTASLAASLYKDNNSSIHLATSKKFISKKRARIEAFPEEKALGTESPRDPVDYPTFVIFNTVNGALKLIRYMEENRELLHVPTSHEETMSVNSCSFIESRDDDQSVEADSRGTSSTEVNSESKPQVHQHDSFELLHTPGQSLIDLTESPAKGLGRAKAVRIEGATVRENVDIDSSRILARYFET